MQLEYSQDDIQKDGKKSERNIVIYPKMVSKINIQTILISKRIKLRALRLAEGPVTLLLRR